MDNDDKDDATPTPDDNDLDVHPPQRVAIIGGGYVGMTAAWALTTHSDADVHIFTAEYFFRSFSRYIPAKVDDRAYELHTGLSVYKEACSPNLQAFLQKLQLPNDTTDFMFNFSSVYGPFRWFSSESIDFADLPFRNPWSWEWLRLWFHVIRFNWFALDVLRSDSGTAAVPESVGAYLRRNKYPDEFRDWYLVPLMAVLWGCQNTKDAMNFPIKLLVQHMWDYDLLRLFFPWFSQPWKAVTLGHSLTGKVVNSIPAWKIHRFSYVHSIMSVGDGTPDGRKMYLCVNGRYQAEAFDHVILACSPEAATNILRLSSIPNGLQTLARFKRVTVYDGRPLDLMHPPRFSLPRTAFKYNSNYGIFLANTVGGVNTYSLGEVTALWVDSKGDKGPESMVTVEQKDINDFNYTRFNHQAYRALARLELIQHRYGISFCGPWVGFGRLEDGITSALRAAEYLGVRPIEIVSYDQSKRPVPRRTKCDILLALAFQLLAIAWRLWMWL